MVHVQPPAVSACFRVEDAAFLDFVRRRDAFNDFGPEGKMARVLELLAADGRIVRWVGVVVTAPTRAPAMLGASSAYEHFDPSIRPELIEEDYYVTEALCAIVWHAGDHVILKGGARLSN